MSVDEPSPPAEAKEPTIGLLLSLCVTGLGHAYARRWSSVVLIVAVSGTLLWTAPAWIFWIFHGVQAIAGGGAVSRWNRQHAPELIAPVPPPVRRRGPAPPAPPDPEPVPAPPPRDDEPSPPRRRRGPSVPPPVALADIRDASRQWTSGRISREDFGERKRDLIERMGAAGLDEGTRCLEEATRMVAQGILTPRERALLQTRLARP